MADDLNVSRTRAPGFVPRPFAVFTTLIFAGVSALALIGLVIVLGLAAWLGSYVLYYKVFPAYSAAIRIEGTGATVKLEFFYSEDDRGESSRYLTVQTPSGTATRNMCGYDWAHWARTGIYRTEDGKIAVLGRGGCDYLFSLHPLAETNAAGTDSDQWTYLGAFDFVGYPRGTADPTRLRFIPAADQAECIEMVGEPIKASDPTARNHARRMRCPLPEPRLSKPEN